MRICYGLVNLLVTWMIVVDAACYFRWSSLWWSTYTSHCDCPSRIDCCLFIASNNWHNICHLLHGLQLCVQREQVSGSFMWHSVALLSKWLNYIIQYNICFNTRMNDFLTYKLMCNIRSTWALRSGTLRCSYAPGNTYTIKSPRQVNIIMYLFGWLLLIFIICDIPYFLNILPHFEIPWPSKCHCIFIL